MFSKMSLLHIPTVGAILLLETASRLVEFRFWPVAAVENRRTGVRFQGPSEKTLRHDLRHLIKRKPR
jgi:hypothetical protein